jgi:Mrp family chromosome partitioning ATPase
MAASEKEENPSGSPIKDISHVVAVLSGKGGLGKSSVAAILAVALRRRGKRVGVLDGDITGPSTPTMYGLHKQPTMGRLGILTVAARSRSLAPARPCRPPHGWGCRCWDDCHSLLN